MSPTSLRVAIVEAEGETIQFLQQMISDLGHEVIAITESGQSLIEICESLRPDVVLTGRFTEMNDADTAAVYGTWQIPVILYAAYGREVVSTNRVAHSDFAINCRTLWHWCTRSRG